MTTIKISISIEEEPVSKLDRLVKNHIFSNRGKVIQEAIEAKLSRIDKSRLAKESSKLDRKFERALAEEGFSSELEEWPEY